MQRTSQNLLLNTIISPPLSRILAKSSLHGVGIKNIMGFTVAAVTMLKKIYFYDRKKAVFDFKIERNGTVSERILNYVKIGN